ncbi:MAG: DegT/DnrJ/EryC1/StrS family aminotransferase [Alteromonadaceae bacterium]|nr:DegT/DnrJ/EryC1/StrS family aminotransferase [Alteromonadaceae bacterium]
MAINLNQPIKPDIKQLTKYLEQVNDSGWYTNFGPLHQKLTSRLEEYLGVKNLLLVSNGTLALQVAYKTLNVTDALTTPFSFVATASSLIWQGIETSFSDIDEKSYNLCPSKAADVLALHSEVNTVVATHVYGNPCDVIAFDELSKQHNIKIIYDAAHAFGIKVNGESVLNFGDASVLSFHATKIFHTVEGGAVVFKDKVNFDKAKEMINFGINHDQVILNVGINAKLNEYQAAVGLVNLDGMDNVLEHRSNLFHAYCKGLAEVVEIPYWHRQANVNGAYMPIKLKDNHQRERVRRVLNSANIQCRQYFSPSLDQIFVDSYSYSTENSHMISEGILCLPLHTYMTLEEVFVVIENVKKGVK